MDVQTYDLERLTDGPEPRYAIRGVELWTAHVYKGSKVTGEKPTVYDDAYTKALVEASQSTPGKSFIGHNYPGHAQPERKVRARLGNIREEFRPDPKTGKARKVAVADVVDADPLLTLSIARGNFTHRSPEVKRGPDGKERISALAWLGSKDQHFDFPEVKLKVNKKMIDQIKADVKDMGPTLDNEDVTLLREANVEGMEPAATEADRITRLEGMIVEQNELVKEFIARVANLEKGREVESIDPNEEDEEMEDEDAENGDDNEFGGGKPSAKEQDGPPAKTQEPEMAKNRENEPSEAELKLREELEEAQKALADKEAEIATTKLRSELETKYAGLHESGKVVSERNRDAVVAACIGIEDEKIREETFNALTEGLKTVPTEDSTPDANQPTSKPTILDSFEGDEAKKVREMIAGLPADKKNVALKEAEGLLKVRSEIDSSVWNRHGISDAALYIKSNI